MTNVRSMFMPSLSKISLAKGERIDDSRPGSPIRLYFSSAWNLLSSKAFDLLKLGHKRRKTAIISIECFLANSLSLSSLLLPLNNLPKYADISARKSQSLIRDPARIKYSPLRIAPSLWRNSLSLGDKCNINCSQVLHLIPV